METIDETALVIVDDYDYNDQALLWTINLILKDIKMNSDTYISLLKETIKKMENGDIKTDLQESQLNLCKYKLSSILENRTAKALSRKEQERKENG